MRYFIIFSMFILSGCIKLEYVKPKPVEYYHSTPPPPSVLEPINVDNNSQNNRGAPYWKWK